MRKKITCFAAMALAIGMIASCTKDKDDDSWKEIPDTVITAESGQATLSVNGIPEKSGNVKFTAKSKSEGSLTLSNVIPGYSTVEVPVSIKGQKNDTFEFSGSVSLSKAPAVVSLFSISNNTIFTVSAQGQISLDGTVAVKAGTALSEQAMGGISGTWKTSDQLVTNPELGIVTSAPIMLKWTSKVPEVSAKFTAPVNMVNLFGSMAVFNYLQSVTFNEDGNITASYYDGDQFSMASMDETTGKLTASHSEWTNSPKANLAFWYTAGENLFIVPNIAAISAAGGEGDGSSSSDFDIQEIISTISALKEYGVDVKTLISELTKIMNQGFAVKYAAEGNSLKIYADKSVCGNVIDAIIPAAGVLDELLPAISEGNPEAAQYIAMIKGIFGLEKFADLETLWKATDEFCITLSLAR